jgi:hypothetical protein
MGMSGTSQQVILSHTPCGCAPVRESGGLGHLTVSCREPGCGSRWYKPKHDPQSATALSYPSRSLG